jgi:hypothetical protein
MSCSVPQAEVEERRLPDEVDECAGHTIGPFGYERFAVPEYGLEDFIAGWVGELLRRGCEPHVHSARALS